MAIVKKIGIDARILLGQYVGVSRYLINYLKFLVADNNFDVWLFSNREIKIPAELADSALNIIIDKTFSRVPGSLWVSFRLNHLLSEYKIDIFWGVQQLIPINKLKNVKYIVTIHDVVHLKYPKSMQFGGLLFNKLFFSNTLCKADHVIFVSESTRDDVVLNYKNIIDILDKSTVIYQIVGTGVRFSSNENQPRGNFLFTIGSVEPRKNLIKLLTVFSALKKRLPSIKLVIAGGKSWGGVDLEYWCRQLNLIGSVELLGKISEDTRLKLLSKCAAYIFPSLYEGYGIPAVECVHNAPLICSDIAVFRELSRHIDGINIVDFSKSDEAIAQRIIGLFADEKLINCQYVTGSELLFDCNNSFKMVKEILTER